MRIQIIIYSPLEQFSIDNIIISTNINLTLFFLSLFIFYFITSGFLIYNKNFKTKFLSKTEQFIKIIFKNNIVIQIPFFYTFIIFLFIMILFSNVFGITPFAYTITSSLLITFFLSFISFNFVNYLAVKKHKWYFFNIFLPKGVPSFIIPFIIIVELISYTARLLSLAIRLFANMMAGHILLEILIHFFWIFFLNYLILSCLIYTPIMLIIFLLEICISFLQAYVFTTLVCIYFNEAINLH